ncbi:MAG TPA: thermonuclease family protein, partial [Thermoanaerobaculia bacterium]|nr:thermonuclease family protein [Thermoanaerobaculia bacterium]
IDGKSLSRELLRCGLAWWNKKYEPDDLDLRRLEDAARAAKLGLWSQENPIPPWEHRRRHSGG